MKIRYLPKTGIAPLIMASEEMEVIRVVKPGEQYPLGGAGMINRSDKLIYVCKEGPVHEVAVDEDHVRILPPEFKSRRETVVKEALGYINDYRGSKVVTLPTGEAALNFDCYWAIIHRPDGMPKLRLKARQREFEELYLHPNEREGLDYAFADIFDEKRICDEADRLFHLV